MPCAVDRRVESARDRLTQRVLVLRLSGVESSRGNASERLAERERETLCNSSLSEAEDKPREPGVLWVRRASWNFHHVDCAVVSLGHTDSIFERGIQRHYPCLLRHRRHLHVPGRGLSLKMMLAIGLLALIPHAVL